MKAREIINDFLRITAQRDYAGEVIWLDNKQMLFNGKTLYINTALANLNETDIERVYDQYSHDLECGATFMLVGILNGKRYCTLLLDSYGSDDDIEKIEGKLYYHSDPYIKNLIMVPSRLYWIFLKHLIARPRLSSLDYAFSRKQIYA